MERVTLVDALFQPTLPLRGATGRKIANVRHRWVSTHAPLAGSDTWGASPTASRSSFNPRSPCGERRYLMPPEVGGIVSTHAPLAGSDLCKKVTRRIINGFNPRSPCGERHLAADVLAPAVGFQPTLPLRGATASAWSVQHRRTVSTHAPLAGSDAHDAAGCACAALFQPTLPLRGATCPMRQRPRSRRCFNPRSPCGERH